jgi:hypothetical protein
MSGDFIGSMMLRDGGRLQAIGKLVRYSTAKPRQRKFPAILSFSRTPGKERSGQSVEVLGVGTTVESESRFEGVGEECRLVPQKLASPVAA